MQYDPQYKLLVCPCHGAQFTMEGAQSQDDYYPISLPPLPPVKVRTRDRHVEVWTI